LIFHGLIIKGFLFRVLLKRKHHYLKNISDRDVFFELLHAWRQKNDQVIF